MNRPAHRFSRPLYEALPWIYMVCGVLALVLSYFHPSTSMSFMLGVPGVLAVLGGVVVALRRRDYRQLKANNYFNEKSSSVLPKTDD